MIKVFFGNLSFSLFQFFLIFFILKTEGSNTLGYYALYVSILNPIQQLFKLGIPKLILSEVNFREQKTYYIVSFYSFLLFIVIGLFICLLIDVKYVQLLIALLLFKALINFRESIFSIYLRHKLFKSYFQSSTIANMLLILIFWVTYQYTESLNLSFYAASLIVLFFSIIDIFRQIKLLKLLFSDFYLFDSLKPQLIRMSKMSMANAIFNIKSNLPKYIIASNFSITFVGVYTAIFQAVSIIEVANQSILKYYGADLTMSFQKGKSQFKTVESKTYYLTFFIVLLSFIVCAFYGDVLLNTFLGEEFVPYYIILLIMIIERFFYMLNSIPKTTFILLDKINLNILNTIIVTSIMCLVLIYIDNFILFNLITALFSVIMFTVNKLVIKKAFKNHFGV